MAAPAAMRFCGACGRPLSHAGNDARQDAVGAQRRHLTVMFCDLVGSTPLSHAFDPEELRELILSYQKACARAVERFEGYVARFVGDGLLVYFGYPRAREDDAVRAIHAGLGILAELAALNVRLREQHDLTLHVRVGVHTGLVVAGELGVGPNREEFGIVGETPNIAARVESVAEPDSVTISDATLELAAGYFYTVPLGPHALKGVPSEVGLHAVVRATGVHNRLDITPRRTATPFLGRFAELARLRALWSRARAGDGSVSHVRGEAGIGKSRLLRTLREQVAGSAGSVQVWQCSAYHRNTALFPVVGYLERLLGFDASQRDVRALEALEAMASGAGVDPAGAVHLLAALLSIPAGGTPGRILPEPRDTRAETLRVLEAVLVGRRSLHPLLLIVEDLHWADPTTVDFLNRIVAGVSSAPVLAAFTFRPTFTPPWSGHEAVVEFPLRPLTREEISSLIAAVAPDIDASVVERVVEAADGVPLFVEELLKMIAAAEDAESGAPDGIKIPPTLRSLLTEKLDRLPHCRGLIDAAAVVRTDIRRDLLDGLQGIPRAGLDAEFADLIAHDVLRPGAEGARPGYEFSHALLQQAAYESILRNRRTHLHRQVANALVERCPDRAAREPEVVAHHYACGGEPARSVPYWEKAGLRSLERAAFVEAARHFAQGIEALDSAGAIGDDDRRAQFQGQLAASLQAGRGYAAAGVGEAYARARQACLREGSEDRRRSIIRGEWLFHHVGADYEGALVRAEEMLTLGDLTQRQDVLAEGHLLRAMVLMYRGELVAARHHFERAIGLYQPPETSDVVQEAQGDTGVMALAYLAPVLFSLGNENESFARSDQSLALADRVGGPVSTAQAWGMRSLLHLLRKEVEQFAEWIERTRAHSADRHLPYWQHLSDIHAGWLRGRHGELAAGIAVLESGIAAYVGAGARLGLGSFRILQADLLVLAGDHAGALEALAAGERFVGETGERLYEASLLIATGRTLMGGPDPDTESVARAYTEAVNVARRQKSKVLELRATAHLTEYQHVAGRPLSELGALAELCASFPPSSSLADLRAARTVLARVRSAS